MTTSFPEMKADINQKLITMNRVHDHETIGQRDRQTNNGRSRYSVCRELPIRHIKS